MIAVAQTMFFVAQRGAERAQICRLTGGDLTVTSAYGEGSTFTVRLPASVSEAVS